MHEESFQILPVEKLNYWTETDPNRVAFTFSQERWTYARLSTASARLARSLVERGIEPGDRVVLHMANLPEMMIAFYACFRIGAIAVPLHVRLKAAELRALLQRLRPAMFLGEADFYHAAAEIESNILAADARFVIGGPVEDGRARPWDDVFEDNGGPLAEFHDDDAPAVLLMTSGTSGLPKFVAHTHATLAAAADVAPRLGVESGQTVLGTTTMAHASGLWVTLSSIHFGVPIVFMRSFDPEAALDLIEAHKCSWMFNLPFMSVELIRSQRMRTRNVSSLQTCAVGGDVCPKEVQLEFHEVFGTPLRPLWGSTEAGVPLDFGSISGAVSRLAPGTEVRLIDDAGKIVPPGETGELIIQAPGLAAGYWMEEGKVDGLRQHGWFHTGDLMREGDGDELWFVSRKKELIVRGGDNISPVEVEQVLLQHPSVGDAAVVGIFDGVLGQRVVALVQLRPDMGRAAIDDIRANVSAQLASYKVPERLLAVDTIPKNALGKTDRRAAAEVASHGTFD